MSILSIRRTCKHVVIVEKTETSEKMVKMPEQREEFLKWHRILGENIILNAEELKSSMVCRNHFDEKLDVPKLEFQHKHHVLKPKHKCCYCEKEANHKSMTRVPKNESILADWAAILGQCFFERVRRTKYAQICRSHFDIKWNGLRPRKLLPIADLNKNLDEEKPENHFVHQNSDQQFICAYCGEAKCYRQMTMFTQNSCKFIKWAENFDKAFSRRASKMKKAYFCRSHFDVEEENCSSGVSASAESAKIDDEKGFSKTYVYTCCQCGEKRELEAMIKTPQKREHFLRWHQMVGEQICGNVPKSSMVCRSHLNDEYGDSRLTDVIRKNGCIQTIIGERGTCCYCGKLRVRRSMTVAFRKGQYFDEWVKILGKRFYERVQNKNSGFVCRSHFNVEWDRNRPMYVLPVADLDDNSAEKTSEINSVTVSNGDIFENEKPSYVFENYIKTENENMESVEKNLDYFSSDESSEPKKIKFEVKEEKEEEYMME